MKLLTFLGTGDYKQVIFCIGDCQHETRFCAAALVNLVEGIQQVKVFVTPQAKQQWYRAVYDEIAPRADCCPVDIPPPERPELLWEIFRLVCNELREGEAVLDVTHGFRAIPIVGLMAVSFMHATRPEAVRSVYYGAFEAVPREEKVKPIWDLTPLVELMDWTSALEMYTRTGNATGLGDLTDRVHRRAWEYGDHHESRPRSLQSVGRALRDLSSALAACRPRQVPERARKALKLMEEARQEAARYAPAFEAIQDRLRDETGVFARKLDEAKVASVLDHQLDMIRWYVKHKQPLHAFALAREWLVTLECFRSGLSWTDKEQRAQAERALGAAEHAAGEKTSESPEPEPSLPEPLPLPQPLMSAWSWVSNTRNDLLHCGMRPVQLSPNEIESRLTELEERLSSVRPLAPSVETGKRD